MIVDILPPEWSNCPLETYIQYADRNKDTAKFESTEPEARDNVDGVVTASLFSGPGRGEVVKTGSYISIYLATDRAGNKAKQCHIKTIVRREYILTFVLFIENYQNIRKNKISTF